MASSSGAVERPLLRELKVASCSRTDKIGMTSVLSPITEAGDCSQRSIGNNFTREGELGAKEDLSPSSSKSGAVSGVQSPFNTECDCESKENRRPKSRHIRFPALAEESEFREFYESMGMIV
eukprot:TRINITY_DN17_c0_g1_i1.p1 TRINITY_DN17_c0_g1~~TRINITY_DN17_c0_g1_i1.p1  ORF type:complete len:130 (+),score=21.68 TRINITY_DN17_c0_g1_i1:27-392(+)